MHGVIQMNNQTKSNPFLKYVYLFIPLIAAFSLYVHADFQGPDGAFRSIDHTSLDVSSPLQELGSEWEKEVGSILRVAHHPHHPAPALYAAAYQTTLQPMGSFGPAAIYRIDTTLEHNVNLFADLNALFDSERQNHNPNGVQSSMAGMSSLGGVSFGEKDSRLYVMNLNDRSLYALGVKPTGEFDGIAYRAQIPSPTEAMKVTGITEQLPLGDLRPFAVHTYQNKIYVGMVNSASSVLTSDASTSALKAYVFEAVDLEGSLAFSPSPVFQVDLAEAPIINEEGTITAWVPWNEASTTLEEALTHPQPLLTQIEFDEEANMELVFRNRRFDLMTGEAIPDARLIQNHVLKTGFNPNALDKNPPSAPLVGPELTITKTANAPEVSAGDPIGFTITVSNIGRTADATDVTVSDPLPGGTGVNWSISPPVSGFSISGSAPNQTLNGSFATLAAGANATVHVVSPTSFASCGTYSNTASASASNAQSPSPASATITVDCPSLKITKTADAATVSAGDPIGFTITVSNGGPGTAKGVTLDDPLPTNPGLSWSIDSQSPGWGGPLSFQIKIYQLVQ